MSLSAARHPRSLRRPLVLFVLVALTASAWYVHSRGGWVNVLHLPPVLDASTPRGQCGFTLARISREADADPISSLSLPIVAYVLIKPPAFPACSHGTQTLDGLYVYTKAQGAADPIVQATGQTSGGDVTSLLWLIVGSDSGPQYLRVQLPGGYSGDTRFMDVSLVTNSGPFPRWRLKRLPPMRLAIPAPVAERTQAAVSGISVSGRAFRNHGMIRLQADVTVPPGSHQWEVTDLGQHSQWEPYDPPPAQGSGSWTVPPSNHLTKYDWFPAPYRSASRYVFVRSEMRQFETYDEPVTFHGVEVKNNEEEEGADGRYTHFLRVTHEQSVTTPSGIRVTLPVQGKGVHQSLTSNCLNVYLSVQPSDALNALPSSPLARQYDKPVKLSVIPPAPGHLTSWTAEDGPLHQYAIADLQSPQNGPQDFTIIVRQRVDIQTIPMTFTVPVSDTPPPDFK